MAAPKDCLHFVVCDRCPNCNPEECEFFESESDYEKVVRCKDCDIPHNKWTGCPKMNGLIPPPDHFCSFGKRKE